VSELEKEFAATLQARQEVGPELEPQLVERFVEKLEAEIDRRVDQRLAARRRSQPSSMAPVVLGSLGISIPLMGIAGGTAGLGGIAFVCLAIVLVNLFWAATRR
jgi:hypothetical protein